MPFDSAETTITIPETAYDRRRRLISALRSPKPKGFRWNYENSTTCAIGLARRLGLIKNYSVAELAIVIGIDNMLAHRIFTSQPAHTKADAIANLLEQLP